MKDTRQILGIFTVICLLFNWSTHTHTHGKRFANGHRLRDIISIDTRRISMPKIRKCTASLMLDAVAAHSRTRICSSCCANHFFSSKLAIHSTLRLLSLKFLVFFFVFVLAFYTCVNNCLLNRWFRGKATTAAAMAAEAWANDAKSNNAFINYVRDRWPNNPMRWIGWLSAITSFHSWSVKGIYENCGARTDERAHTFSQFFGQYISIVSWKVQKRKREGAKRKQQQKKNK